MWLIRFSGLSQMSSCVCFSGTNIVRLDYFNSIHLWLLTEPFFSRQIFFIPLQIEFCASAQIEINGSHVIWRWCVGQEASTLPCSEPHHRCSWPLPSFPQRHSRAGACAHVYVCTRVSSVTQRWPIPLSPVLVSQIWGPTLRVWTPSHWWLKSHDIPMINIPAFSGHWDPTDEDSSVGRGGEYLSREEDTTRRVRKRREGEVMVTLVFCCDPHGTGEPGTPVLCGRCS